MGYFPGGGEYNSEDKYATAVFLPESTDIAPDHSELEALLSTKLPKDKYTEESYEKYEMAFVAAGVVNANVDATMEQIKIAINELKEAEATLGEKITFECKMVGKEESIRTLEAATVGLKFYIYVPPMTGYEFESVSGATYTALASKDGSGFISGTKSADKDVVIWYTNVPSTTRLEEVIAETPALDQSSYTASFWSAYQTALAAATDFSVDSNTMQSDVDAKVKTLTDALTGLVTESTTTKFVDIVKLILCTGRVQTLSSGETVKIWLVNFPADEIGSFEYTVTATGANDTAREKVSITVN